ncbi:Signal transduction histidine kinase [Nocardioides sp. YR527]|nr:Signal transduction histidine kinase [Nocardioides sp. YR527]
MTRVSPREHPAGIRTDTHIQDVRGRADATLPTVSAWTSPAAIEVESRLFRALAVLRVVVLINALGLTIYRAANFDPPAAALVCALVMVGWTVFALWAYAAPARRTAVLVGADLAVALGLLLVTPLVKGPGFQASVPGFWVSGALLACAIHYRWIGGLLAGVALAAVDLAQRQEIDQAIYGNAFLLLIGGPVVGYMCESVQRMALERDEAQRAAARAEERARLARAVHDGVLQVLALVQRRGGELGGDAAELGRLAGEQERELRALIRGEQPGQGPAAGMRDLAVALAELETGTVTVSGPATAVEMPARQAEEIVAATRAALDNVRRHVGEDARAWVLLQAFPDHVEVSVRDDGPGIAEGRVIEAGEQGRLGISESIRGRIEDLGGKAELITGATGTEWELTVPRTGVHA